MKIPVRTVLTATSLMLAVTACGKKEVGRAGAAARCSCARREGPERLHLERLPRRGHDPELREGDRHQGHRTTSTISNEELETQACSPVTRASTWWCRPRRSCERQIKAGVFQKLDKSQLPNLQNMDPDIMNRVGLHDPNNEYAVPYMWGTTGIGYNEDKIKKIFGERAGSTAGTTCSTRSTSPRTSRTAASSLLDSADRDVKHRARLDRARIRTARRKRI